MRNKSEVEEKWEMIIEFKGKFFLIDICENLLSSNYVFDLILKNKTSNFNNRFFSSKLKFSLKSFPSPFVSSVGKVRVFMVSANW